MAESIGDRKCFYNRRGIHKYRKMDGTISEYKFSSLVPRTRKIASDETDFKAFMIEFIKLRDSKAAARNVKIAHTAAIRMALNMFLSLYEEKLASEQKAAEEEADTQQDDSASQSYLSTPTA